MNLIRNCKCLPIAATALLLSFSVCLAQAAEPVAKKVEFAGMIGDVVTDEDGTQLLLVHSAEFDCVVIVTALIKTVDQNGRAMDASLLSAGDRVVLAGEVVPSGIVVSRIRLVMRPPTFRERLQAI